MNDKYNLFRMEQMNNIKAPDGYEIKWGVKKLDEYDYDNDVDAYRKETAALENNGWTTVDPKLYPKLPNKNGLIEYDGLVLFMRELKHKSIVDRLIEGQQPVIDLERKLESEGIITNIGIGSNLNFIMKDIVRGLVDNKIKKLKERQKSKGEKYKKQYISILEHIKKRLY